MSGAEVFFLIVVPVVVVLLIAGAIIEAASHKSDAAHDERFGQQYHRAATNKPPFDLRHYASTGTLRRRPFDWERD